MRRMMLIFVLLGVILALGGDALAEKRPALKGQIGWVPGSGYKHASGDGWTDSAVYSLDVTAVFGRRMTLLAMHSSTDFDLFVMQSAYLAAPTDSTTERMSVSATAAQIDSLLNFTATVPAAGVVVEGFLPWLVAPAASDTLWISGYVWE